MHFSDLSIRNLINLPFSEGSAEGDGEFVSVTANEVLTSSLKFTCVTANEVQRPSRVPLPCLLLASPESHSRLKAQGSRLKVKAQGSRSRFKAQDKISVACPFDPWALVRT